MAHFDTARAIWLARFILPHEPSLRSWLRGQRGLPLDPDDLVQESYALLAALNSVDHITNPRAYLFQTAKSLILRDLRRAKIVSILTVENLDELGFAADEPTPERQASDREELRRLVDALEKLPSHCRKAFLLRKIEGVSQKEIAVRLGLAEKTVEKHVALAVQLLMDILGRSGKTPPRASKESKSRSQHVAQRIREQ